MRTPVQLVTIDNVFENIEAQKATTLFSGMMRVRAAGYGPPDYEPRLLPFDLTDFVARHHLFCIRKQDEFVPIGGLKVVELTTCEYYSLPFPLLSIAREASAFAHEQAVLNALEKHAQDGRQVLYSGSWTVEKSYRADPQLGPLFKELVAALFCMELQAHGDSVLFGMGALRFKTEQYFEKVGFTPVTLNGEALAPTGIKHANNEPVVLLELSKPSEWARSCLEKHQFLLRSRKIVGGARRDHAVRRAA